MQLSSCQEEILQNLLKERETYFRDSSNSEFLSNIDNINMPIMPRHLKERPMKAVFKNYWPPLRCPKVNFWEFATLHFLNYYFTTDEASEKTWLTEIKGDALERRTVNARQSFKLNLERERWP